MKPNPSLDQLSRQKSPRLKKNLTGYFSQDLLVVTMSCMNRGNLTLAMKDLTASFFASGACSHWNAVNRYSSFRTSAASRGEFRNPVRVQYTEVISGSRLASAVGVLGRDDEMRHSLLGERGHVVFLRR